MATVAGSSKHWKSYWEAERKIDYKLWCHELGMLLSIFLRALVPQMSNNLTLLKGHCGVNMIVSRMGFESMRIQKYVIFNNNESIQHVLLITLIFVAFLRNAQHPYFVMMLLTRDTPQQWRLHEWKTTHMKNWISSTQSCMVNLLKSKSLLDLLKSVVGKRNIHGYY